MTQHSNQEVDIDIENPMLNAIRSATHFSKRLFSILLQNKIPASLIFVIMFIFKRLFKSQRMKGKVLSFLMALSILLFIMVLKVYQ